MFYYKEYKIMVCYVLDQNFNRTTVLDHYESLIWVDRFWEPGEFEIYLPAGDELFTFLAAGNYLIQKNSEHVMIMEGIKIDTDVEDGNKVTVTGRSIESILDRRIIAKQTDFNDKNLQEATQQLLNENIISPSIPARKISNFIFEASTDTKITSLKLTAQYTGDNLLDVIVDICKSNKIGFKITLNDSNQFVFKLYAGTDRSYEQSTEDYVVFSPKFDNFNNSNYEEDEKPFKNITLVAGEGEGTDRKTLWVGNGSGLNRKELYTDARDLQKKDEEGQEISDAEYNAKLHQRGLEKLSECEKTEKFDGETDPFESFVYDRDYTMGDIVQLRNEYGFEAPSRITEFIFSENTQDGLNYYPTFEVVQDEEE